MLSNIEVYQFSGTNSELCESLGIQPSTDSPAHFYNYTARSVRARAVAAIAAGRADEPFEVKTAKTATAKTATAKTATAKTNSPSATEILPSELLAILPAISYKLGASDLKTYIKYSSSDSDGGQAKLPDVVIDILEFFGISSDDIQEKLLRWAGVKTRRDYIAEKLSAAIGTLSAESNAKFADWDVEKMQSLLEALTAFALLSDSTKGGN